MPILKVPLCHKFGIISLAQREELKHRILESVCAETLTSKKNATSSWNPFEVTEAFVEEFNSAQTLEDQERLEAFGKTLLERIKRRSGLKDGGIGDHVDLSLAWTELMQLSQCKGKFQEDCIDVLITSLEQSPMRKSHIAAMFFMAESVLYWLRTEAINTPYLRTAELKLLKIGMVVFLRMYYHYMCNHLASHEDFKTRLFTYLDGFADCQDAYSPYPNALMYVRFMNDVGNMIISDVGLQLKNSTNYAKQNFTVQQTHCDDSRLNPEGFSPTYQSDGLSASVHDLSPTLWHSLDVWRCVHQYATGLPDALRALEACGMSLASESWVDAICAMHILADSAKTDIRVLKSMQKLAKGIVFKSGRTNSRGGHVHASNTKDHKSATTVDTSSKFGLSDIVERSEYSSSYVGKSKTTEDDESKNNSNDYGENKPPGTGDKFKSSTIRLKTQESGLSKQTGLSGWQAEAGSEGGRQSQTSSVPTYTNQTSESLYGMHGWRWEVALVYVDMMANIALYAATSSIAKMAMVGNNGDLSLLHKTARQATYPLNSAGLIDMVYYHALSETTDGGRDDWSWRVRYEAMQGLVKVFHCNANNIAKDGIRNVAWSQLQRSHRTEMDRRVLEAFQVGQVDAKLADIVSNQMMVAPSYLGAKLAEGLAKLYLPMLTCPLPPLIGKKPKPLKHPMVHKPVVLKPMRTSLKEEIQLATALYEAPCSYEKKTDYDLRRVIEDQWRKELQICLQKEEVERIHFLKHIQNDKEAAENLRIQAKSAKMEGKTIASLRHKSTLPVPFLPTILSPNH